MLALIEKAIYEAEKATGEEISAHSDVQMAEEPM